MLKKLNKKAIVSEYLPWILIAVAVLVILFLSIYFMSGKGAGAISSIKNLFAGG